MHAGIHDFRRKISAGIPVMSGGLDGEEDVFSRFDVQPQPTPWVSAALNAKTTTGFGALRTGSWGRGRAGGPRGTPGPPAAAPRRSPREAAGRTLGGGGLSRRGKLQIETWEK